MVTEEVDLDRLAIALVDRMKNHHAIWIDPETHAEQHEFLVILMRERRERAERRKAIEDKIAGSLLLSLIVGVIVLLGSGMMQWLREHL